MPDLFLTDTEIDVLCAPLRQPAAQVRFLRTSGLKVTVKPNGRPAVVRSHAESVLSGQHAPSPSLPSVTPGAAAPQPNVDGFMKVIEGGRRHGSQKKVQPA